MKRLILLTLFCLLSSCANLSYYQVGRTYESTVRLHVVKDADRTCRPFFAGRVPVSSEILACATWDFRLKTCDIIMDRSVSHSTLGHELRHCYEGHFHAL